MKFKRLAFIVATVALGVPSAASSYKVKLDAPLSIGSTELKAGEYKVEMQGDKAVFKTGKTVRQIAAEKKLMSDAELNKALDARRMTTPQADMVGSGGG